MTEKVWIRFEIKTKDGATLKLRIQDLPADRVDEAMELRLKYFVRDEVVHEATGILKNPEAVEVYKEYLNMLKQDPRRSTVICCKDEEEVGDILGVSSVSLVTEDFNWDEILEKTKDGPEETKKLTAVFKACSDMYKPVEVLKLEQYLDDDTVLVMPDYRGHGIALQFLRQRRLQCASLGVAWTGGWMTGHGTQAAAARDGWRTACELDYGELARAHGLRFHDAPPTMKYMLAGPLRE